MTVDKHLLHFLNEKYILKSRRHKVKPWRAFHKSLIVLYVGTYKYMSVRGLGKFSLIL